MKKKQILMIMAIMFLSITLFALNDMGKGGSYDGVALLASGVINLGNVASAVDFPANQGTDVGGGTTITPTADLNYAQDQTIPPTPNSNFIAGYEGVFTGSGILTISISTSYQYGAYYQNGSWYSQVNSGGTILFENLNFDAKGDIPIILGNDNPLPVELSSFTAIQTASNFAQLNWTTQSENNLLGYNIYRSKVENYQSSIILNQSLVNPANTSLVQYYSYTDKNVELGNTYYYWLQSVESDGNTELYGPISIRIEDEETPELPNQTVLYPAYPNPFNPQTTIKFSVKENENGLFEIFNIKGQIVKRYPMFSPGNHEINWNGTDDNGNKVSSGVFFYKLKSESVIQIHKMLLLK